MFSGFALLLMLGVSPPAEPAPLTKEPIFLDNSADDQGCCSIQKIKGTKTWDCHQDSRRNCAQTVRDLALESSRWNFDKDKSCSDVPNCQ